MGNSSYAGSQASRKVFQRKQLIFFLAGLVALIIFISLSDFNKVLDYISLSNKITFSLAFVSMLLGVLAYAFSWIVLLRSAKIKLGIFRALEGTWISVFFNIMVPTASVAGEIVRILYVVRETEDNYGNVAATVFLHRVVSFLPFIAGSIGGFMYLAFSYNLPAYLTTLLLMISVALFAALMMLILLSVKPKLSIGAAFRITRFLDRVFYRHKGEGSTLTSLVAKAFSEFEESMRLLKTGKVALLLSVVLAFAYWIFDVTVAYFVFASLGYSVPLGIIVAVYTIGISIQIVPIGIPGMVGVVETVMSGLYVIAGVPLSLSVAATVMIRLIMMWLEALVGGLVFVGYSRR
ncbi:MAG: lysylphosphatidylglycerol synthase transmembrane domain-containing protein [Nitrososphaeria archaeon]